MAQQQEEEEVISTNKYKKARNEFRKSRVEKNIEEEAESEDTSIEDVAEEQQEVNTKIEKQEVNGETAAPKKKRKAPKEKVNPIQPVLNFLRDERLHKVIGLAFFLSSVFLLVAFTSFLFTWKTDQDKVMGSWWQLFFPGDEVAPAVSGTGVENWLGKLGAVVSHLFIHK